MIVHELDVRVRYCETDHMGFLYHSHYVEYFDMARTELMRSLGLPNAEIEKAGVMLPVLNVEINYKNPAYYDDLLKVRTYLRVLPKVKIKFEHEVFRPNGEMITTGSVTLAFMGSESKRACRCPQYLLDVLSPYFKDEE